MPPTQLQIEALLQSMANEVANLPKPVIRAILPVLEEAERDLMRKLAHWDATHVRTPTDRFTRAKYRSLLVQLRTVTSVGRVQVARRPPFLTSAISAFDSIMVRQLEPVAQLSVRHLGRELSELGRLFDGTNSTPINLDMIRILERSSRITRPRIQQSVQRYGAAMWRDMKLQLARGFVTGENMHQLASRLKRLTPGAKSPAAGLMGRYKGWAMRVARTEMIHSYNVAHNDAIEEAHDMDDDIRWRWDASLDSRLCPECQSLHGQIRDEDESFQGGIKHPPLHPNCRCAVIAWREDWEHDIDDQISRFVDKDRARALKSEADQKRLQRLAKTESAKTVI